MSASLQGFSGKSLRANRTYPTEWLTWLSQFGNDKSLKSFAHAREFICEHYADEGDGDFAEFEGSPEEKDEAIKRHEWRRELRKTARESAVYTNPGQTQVYEFSHRAMDCLIRFPPPEAPAVGWATTSAGDARVIAAHRHAVDKKSSTELHAEVMLVRCARPFNH